MTKTSVTLITGAGSGIGAAAARLFRESGSAVVLADLSEERLRSVEAELGNDDAVLAIPTDVRDDGAVRALVAAGVERFGGFDTVLPNAGVAFGEKPLEEFTDAEVDQLLAVNLKGVIHTLRATIPHLRDGGSVVLTSSISGLQAHAGAAIYAATKIAIIGLGRSLAAELAPRHIRVNMVCPGGVDTGLTRGVYGDQIDEVIADYAKANPLGRIAQPEDIAQAMVFLASAGADHITGVSLRVDGGDCLLGAV
jgi:meso-butanediol dehydrogenase/(S,S)-butanediol dehydrogenase/diacetyl reductase